VVVIGAVVAVVALTGGSRTPVGSSGRGTATVPAGWSVHRDEASGFAIASPGSWVDATERARSQLQSQSDLLRFAVTDGSGSGANVNVVVEPIPAYDAAAYARANETQLTTLGAQDVQKHDETLPAGPAVVLSYTGGSSINGVHLVQYFLVHGTHGYVVTFTAALGTTFDRELMGQFMNSFELLG
jgi:hypothetical protein